MKSATLLRPIKFLKFGIIALQGFGIAIALYEAYKKTKEKNQDSHSSHLKKKFGEDKDRDLVDETSWESFPASDAPSWNKPSTSKGPHH